MVQIVSEPVSCDFIELVKLVMFVAVFYTRRSKNFMYDLPVRNFIDYR